MIRIIKIHQIVAHAGPVALKTMQLNGSTFHNIYAEKDAARKKAESQRAFDTMQKAVAASNVSMYKNLHNSSSATSAISASQSKEFRSLKEFSKPVDYNKANPNLSGIVIGLTKWHETPTASQPVLTVIILDDQKHVFQMRIYDVDIKRLMPSIKLNHQIEVSNVSAAIQSTDSNIDSKLDVRVKWDTEIQLIGGPRPFHIENVKNSLKENSIKTFKDLPHLVQKKSIFCKFMNSYPKSIV